MRVYTTQIPSPKVPAFVTAILPTTNDLPGSKIAAYHRQVLEACCKCGMQVVSLSADGASEEQVAMVGPENDKEFLGQDGVRVRSTLYGIEWTARNQKNGCSLVFMGEAKHNKKNARNALQSSGRVLDLSVGIASFEQHHQAL